MNTNVDSINTLNYRGPIFRQNETTKHSSLLLQWIGQLKAFVKKLEYKSWYFATFFLALITVMLVFTHPYFPKRHLNLMDLPQLVAYPVSDAASGGNSRAYWLDENSLNFRCELRSSSVNKFCGLSLELTGDMAEGMNLSVYDELILNVSYQGPARQLSSSMGTIPENSQILTNSKLRRMPAEYRLLASELNRDTVLTLERFKTSTWWLLEHSIPTEDAIVNLRNAVTFGLEIAVEAKEFTYGDHEISVNKAILIGNWISAIELYRLLLLSWMAVLIAFLTYTFFGLIRENQLRRELIQVLANSNTELRERSLTDPLTGLLNRTGFSERTPEVSSRNNDFSYSLLIFDLDHFKKINDTYGHDAGDQVLTATAKILLHNTRRSDVCARWGGEEFVLLVPQTTAEQAIHLAEKIREEIAQLGVNNIPAKSITVSVGIAEARSRETFQDAFQRADKALYAAKEKGRNTYVVL